MRLWFSFLKSLLVRTIIICTPVKLWTRETLIHFTMFGWGGEKYGLDFKMMLFSSPLRSLRAQCGRSETLKCCVAASFPCHQHLRRSCYPMNPFRSKYSTLSVKCVCMCVLCIMTSSKTRGALTIEVVMLIWICSFIIAEIRGNRLTTMNLRLMPWNSPLFGTKWSHAYVKKILSATSKKEYSILEC